MSEETTKDYHGLFNPCEFFENYQSRPSQHSFGLNLHNRFWCGEGKLVSNMLEFGAGPTISRFISAAKHVQSIIAAEYLPANRQAMKDWLSKDPKAFNWRPMFEYVVQKLEGLPAEEVDKREAKVREIVKAVVPCDLKAPNPIQFPSNISAQCGPPFDVVSSCYCLEVVVESEKEYKEKVAYLANMVRPGGYLLMLCVLKERFYRVGASAFYTFPLTKELISESLKEAGIRSVYFDFFSSHLLNGEFDEDHHGYEYLKRGDKDHCFVYGQREIIQNRHS